MDIGAIEYERSQRERWVAGGLALEWARRYGALPEFVNYFDSGFDKLAKQLANGELKPARRPYGFFEALAAIVLHNTTGYLPLGPTHDFHFTDSQARIVEELLPPDVVEVIRDRTKGATQAPDLLMYKADLTDWFFCEVKGAARGRQGRLNRDRLNPRQEEKFEEIARASDKPIRVLRFEEAPTRGV